MRCCDFSASVCRLLTDGKVSASIDPLDPNHDNSFDIPHEGAAVQRFSYANVELEQFHFHIGSENAINGENCRVAALCVHDTVVCVVVEIGLKLSWYVCKMVPCVPRRSTAVS